MALDLQDESQQCCAIHLRERIVLDANKRVRDILEPDHDPHTTFKDFTYLEGDDFKTARILRCVLLASRRQGETRRNKQRIHKIE